MDRGVDAEVLMIDEALQLERYRFEKENASQTWVPDFKEGSSQTEYITHLENKEIQTEFDAPGLKQKETESNGSLTGRDSVIREEMITRIVEEEIKSGDEKHVQESLESFFNYVFVTSKRIDRTKYKDELSGY